MYRRPAEEGEAIGTADDGSVLGLARSDWLQNQLHKLLGRLHSDPRTLVIFLADDTYLYDGDDPTADGACCALGFHSAEAVAAAGARVVQTYVYAAWMSPGVFGGGDTFMGSHDPFGFDAYPPPTC